MTYLKSDSRAIYLQHALITLFPSSSDLLWFAPHFSPLFLSYHSIFHPSPFTRCQFTHAGKLSANLSLTKGPRLENESSARSPCSMLPRVLPVFQVPFETTIQPTIEPLKFFRWGEMRGTEGEQCSGEKRGMALLKTIAVNGIIFSPQRMQWAPCWWYANNPLDILHSVHGRQSHNMLPFFVMMLHKVEEMHYPKNY